MKTTNIFVGPATLHPEASEIIRHSLLALHAAADEAWEEASAQFPDTDEFDFDSEEAEKREELYNTLIREKFSDLGADWEGLCEGDELADIFGSQACGEYVESFLRTWEEEDDRRCTVKHLADGKKAVAFHFDHLASSLGEQYGVYLAANMLSALGTLKLLGIE